MDAHVPQRTRRRRLTTKDSPPQNWIYRPLREHPALLVTTSQFIFLYDVDSGRVDILPNESVRVITIYAPR